MRFLWVPLLIRLGYGSGLLRVFRGWLLLAGASVGFLGWGLVPVLVLAGCVVLLKWDMLLVVVGWLGLELVASASWAVLGYSWSAVAILECRWPCSVWRFVAFPS